MVYKYFDVDKSCSSDAKIVISTVRDCINCQLLAAMLNINRVLDAKTVEQANPKRVDRWFQGAYNVSPQDLSEHTDAVLSAVKYTKIRWDQMVRHLCSVSMS